MDDLEARAPDMPVPVSECGSRLTTRRGLLQCGVGAAALLASPRSGHAAEADGKDQRPQVADVLVFSDGERAGTLIKPADLAPDRLVRAWPQDPKTSITRNGSRLNEVLIVKLDPANLDDDTRERAADGVVAYSAICSHAGCPVTAWTKAARGDSNVLKCVCHNSEFDPRKSGQVVFGPAPRRLAALPLATSDGSLTVAAGFIGKLGQQTG